MSMSTVPPLKNPKLSMKLNCLLLCSVTCSFRASLGRKEHEKRIARTKKKRVFHPQCIILSFVVLFLLLFFFFCRLWLHPFFSSEPIFVPTKATFHHFPQSPLLFTPLHSTPIQFLCLTLLFSVFGHDPFFVLVSPN